MYANDGNTALALGAQDAWIGARFLAYDVVPANVVLDRLVTEAKHLLRSLAADS
jgi:hypothetical protein